MSKIEIEELIERIKSKFGLVFEVRYACDSHISFTTRHADTGFLYDIYYNSSDTIEDQVVGMMHYIENVALPYCNDTPPMWNRFVARMDRLGIDIEFKCVKESVWIQYTMFDGVETTHREIHKCLLSNEAELESAVDYMILNVIN